MYLAITIGEVFGDGITSPLKVKVKKVNKNEDKENYDSTNRPSPLPINFHSSPSSTPESLDQESFEETSINSSDSIIDREDNDNNNNNNKDDGERKIKIVNEVSDDDEKEQMIV